MMGMTGYGARGRCRGRRRLLVVLALAAAGCSSTSDQAADLMPGVESGYHWIGAGPRGNFGVGYNFCRQTLQYQDFSNLGSGSEQRGASTVTNNMSDVSITGFPGFPNRSNFAVRRSFDGCMRSQGWARLEQTTPTPPTSQPSPTPTPTPSDS